MPHPTKPNEIEARRDDWCKYTPERAPAIARRAQELAARHGDVYTSWACYRTKKRSKETALPGPSIFLDDAPISQYTFTVETGRGSRHGWILLNQMCDTATRERIARRAAYASRADKGGWDITQLVRVPGTWNTKRKHGGRFPVRLEPGSNQTYTLAQLEARWPAGDEPNPITCGNWGDALDWERVEQHLANIDAITKRIKPHTRTYQQLHGDGGPDRSKTRWGVAMELRKRFGYPDDEAAAILIAYCDYGHSDENGTDWLYADVARCIVDANANYPDILTSRSRCYEPRPAQPLPYKPRPHRGRPRVSSPELHLTWLHEHIDAGDTVLKTQAELAEARGVSPGTVRRDEKELTKRGLIQRITLRRGRQTTSHVVILSAIKNTPASARKNTEASGAVQRITKPQNELERRTLGETHAASGASSPDPVRDSSASSPIVVSPAVAMRAAFAAVGAEGRVTRKRVRACLEHYLPGSPLGAQAFERHYRAEQERRRQEQQDAKLAAELEEMDNRGILRAVRACDRNIAKSQQQGTKAYTYWLARRRLLMAEIRRRHPDLERDEQLALVQFTDRLKAERGRQRRIAARAKELQDCAPQGQQGGVCSSQAAVELVPCARDEAHAMSARWLMSLGKRERALDMVRMIGDPAFRASVEREFTEGRRVQR